MFWFGRSDGRFGKRSDEWSLFSFRVQTRVVSVWNASTRMSHISRMCWSMSDGMPQDIDQHMRLMCDILVLAFQTDTTRVCTLKLNNDHSSLRFPNLPSERPNQRIDYMIHHLLSHTNGEDWLRVNRFFTEQVAYIADRLNRIQEGNRTLLDNSMIMYCSSMMTGNHDNNQLPVVLLGRGGGPIRGGRVLDYTGRPNRKMCSLYLSLMDKAGVRLERFGDSNQA